MKRLVTCFLAAILLLLSACSTGSGPSLDGSIPSDPVFQESTGSTESVEPVRRHLNWTRGRNRNSGTWRTNEPSAL